MHKRQGSPDHRHVGRAIVQQFLGQPDDFIDRLNRPDVVLRWQNSQLFHV